MDATRLFLLLLLFPFLSPTAAQQPTATAALPGGAVLQPTSDDVAVPYRPKIAAVVGIFSIMISVALLLLLYTKLCYSASHNADLFAGRAAPGLPLPRSSGVDKTVIESLPFFRFSSLKGSTEGLECAVCLSRFDGGDLLRLLPKCNHAFHIDCIDRWLQGHSSCPLCRRRVLPHDDLDLFKHATSSRFPSSPPPAAGEAALELYVEREPGEEAGGGSGGGMLGSSVRKMGRAVVGKNYCKKESLLPARGDGGGGGGGDWEEQYSYHRFKHRIVVSGAVFKNRWSDLSPSDLVSLHCEMLRSLSSRGFSPETKRSPERKAGHMNTAGSPSGSGTNSQCSSTTLPRSLDPSANNRAMSEIVDISRFADAVGGSSAGGAAGIRTGEDEEEGEKVRRVWLPIARRTVQWSTTAREKRSDSDKTAAGDDAV